MFVQGFGEILTDILTVNPAFSDLPSASSILDTSNYTFQALTFGKDAEGFVQHSHAISSIQYVDGVVASGASSFDSGILTVINYASDATNGASSYIPSGTYLLFSSTYNSVPNDPSPLDRRLERGSTLSTNLTTSTASGSFTSALPDLGHYANPAVDSQLSAVWNKVGGFAPSGGNDYHFYDKDKNLIFTGTLSSDYNLSGLMDKDGFLTVNPQSVTDVVNTNFTAGAIVFSSVGFTPSVGKLKIRTRLNRGDAMSLVAFGSVKHIGIYCLDLKSILAEGLTPPYNWNCLNNNRKYKLVAKATILDNPIFHRDAAGLSGFGTLLATNSVIINLNLDFK